MIDRSVKITADRDSIYQSPKYNRTESFQLEDPGLDVCCLMDSDARSSIEILESLKSIAMAKEDQTGRRPIIEHRS